MPDHEFKHQPGDPDPDEEFETKTIYKSAIDGRIVSDEYAAEHPDTTMAMEVPVHATDIESDDPDD